MGTSVLYMHMECGTVRYNYTSMRNTTKVHYISLVDEAGNFSS